MQNGKGEEAQDKKSATEEVEDPGQVSMPLFTHL